jgi:putative flippase GtrA
MSFYLQLAILAVAAFVQNMAFTWVSRSRNSGDPSYHRYAAICSNGVWFIVQILMMNQVWKSLTEGEWLRIAITAVVYIAATTEGSVLMMKILLKKESGKRKVGAQ